VAELVDALGLGPSAARRGGSSPFTRTTNLYANVHITIVYWANRLTRLGAVYALHLLVTHF
jgi:hypothetical protein